VRMHRGSSNDFVTTGDVDVPESAFRYPLKWHFRGHPCSPHQPAYCCGEIGTA
jgi:hypothetical protein